MSRYTTWGELQNGFKRANEIHYLLKEAVGGTFEHDLPNTAAFNDLMWRQGYQMARDMQQLATMLKTWAISVEEDRLT